MSYNSVSRELNRRNVPTLRGGKQWYPMTAGRLLSVWSGQDLFLLAAASFSLGRVNRSAHADQR